MEQQTDQKNHEAAVKPEPKGAERRKHKRFSATAFLTTPVYLSPLPPYFGHPVKGKLIDLSAGGLSVLIGEIIPQETFLTMLLTFPDHSTIESVIKVRHVLPRGRAFLHGIEFLNPPQIMVEKISRMSEDYIDCESRIQSKAAEVCRTNCAFFTMCSKPERLNPVLDVNTSLELAFKALEDTPLNP
jgi:hypothetical protein